MDFLRSSPVGLCVRRTDMTVVFQTEACAAVCGRQVGAACERRTFRCCRDEGAARPGMHHMPCERVGGALYDVAAVSDGDHVLTTLYPLAHRVEREMAAFADVALSSREREVLALLLCGMPRAKMAATLGISEETVKTHVRHLYAKTPAALRQKLGRSGLR